jgi:hypothetical protein
MRRKPESGLTLVYHVHSVQRVPVSLDGVTVGHKRRSSIGYSVQPLICFVLDQLRDAVFDTVLRLRLRFVAIVRSPVKLRSRSTCRSTGHYSDGVSFAYYYLRGADNLHSCSAPCRTIPRERHDPNLRMLRGQTMTTQIQQTFRAPLTLYYPALRRNA